MSVKQIRGNLHFTVAESNEAMLFVAAFTARSREEGWNVDDIQVKVTVSETGIDPDMVIGL